MAQAAGKYGEHAPMVTVCNACRTCLTTNVMTLLMGGLAGVGVALTRFARGVRTGR
jgi:hypothetical protein